MRPSLGSLALRGLVVGALLVATGCGPVIALVAIGAAAGAGASAGGGGGGGGGSGGGGGIGGGPEPAPPGPKAQPPAPAPPAPGPPSSPGSGVPAVQVTEEPPEGSGQQSDASQVAVLADGSPVVTGYFEGQVVFAPGQAEETAFTSAGGRDFFLVRYDSGGRLAWAKHSDSDQGWNVAVTSSGLVVTSTFTAPATYGAGEAGAVTVSPAGATDLALGRYEPSTGNLLALKTLGAPLVSALPGSVAPVGTQGAFVLIGSLSSSNGTPRPITFGAGEPTAVTLMAPPAGTSAGFLARYQPDLSLAWARQPTTTGRCGFSSVTILADGSLLTAGGCDGTTTFGAAEPGQTVLTGPSVFLARYAANGDLVSATRVGGPTSGRVAGVFSDGSSVLVGETHGRSTFGPGEVHETTIGDVNSASRAYAARFDASGALTWATDLGPSEGVVATFLPDGTTLVAGSESQQTIFLSRVSSSGASTRSTLFTASNFGYARSLVSAGDGSFFLAGQWAGALTVNGASRVSVGGANLFLTRLR